MVPARHEEKNGTSSILQLRCPALGSLKSKFRWSAPLRLARGFETMLLAWFQFVNFLVGAFKFGVV
jgi:hypothetical protein